MGKRSLQQGEVQPADVVRDILDGVVGDDVQPDVRVSEHQIEIHQDHAVALVLGVHASQVDGQRSRPHTTGYTHHGDDTLGPRFAGTAGHNQRMLNAVQRGEEIVQPQRIAEKLARPAAHGLQDKAALLRTADHEDGTFGQLAADRGDQLQPLGGIRIERNQCDIGLRLPHHIQEELVARTLRLQPYHIDPQQQVLQDPARGFVGIDDG